MRIRVATAAGLCALAASAAFAPRASADTTTIGLGGWRVQSSATAAQTGAQVSAPGFSTASWLRVRPDDGGAVGTEINALLQNGRCPGVFFSTNLKQCFGYMKRVGRETIPMFAVPWWFRTDFRAPLGWGRDAELIVNGVVGQADVWVNGTKVATQATVQGAYTRYTFDITKLARRATNTLALEVHPNNPNTMFTVDNVDWTQIPPDNNTGIQFPIQLHTAGALSLSNTHVVQHNARDVSNSQLTLKGDVTNDSSRPQTGVVSATVTPPADGGRPIRVRKTVTVAPGATRVISFTSADDPRLTIVHPRVWWPYQMGAQPLYGLSMAVSARRGEADSQSETFGIRTITSHLIGASPIAPRGVRQFEVNGRPFVFRGGGWSEDMFLRYSSADTSKQIGLIKNLGLDGIRTEGHQMPDNFYQQMDRAGILIDGGFQCCDAWQLPDHGKGVTEHEYQVLYLSALTIGRQLRNHPSVLNFSWSDNAPIPRQEKVSLRGFSRADFQEPLIASAEYKSSPKLGPSGEKEGPYDWVPPGYWYDTTHFDPTTPDRTNAGGAWAFNSEASAGDTVPTMDSIQRFMSPFEQAQLWQNPDYNQYHLNYEPNLPGPSNGGYSFGTLHNLDQAIAHRYGAWSSLGDYVREAQVQNYETQRAEFEAYIAHSANRRAPSTGIVYWQLNKGWPTLLWDLYNHDFDQAGSYFGAQKANQPLHALYAYDTGTVTVDNLTGARRTGLSVQSRVYDLRGRLLDHRSAAHIAVPAQGLARGVLRPKVPPPTVPPASAQTYFVELLLRSHGAVIGRNVYWLSTQHDVVDWPKTINLPQATMTQFADLSGLQGLTPARLTVTTRTPAGRPCAGSATATDVKITNTSTTPSVGFFLRADLRRGTSAGVPAAGDNQVRPIFWNDNDITLWPGESQTLRACYQRSDLHGQAAVVSVSGWNTPNVNIAAR